ncbi:hypothetical protein YYC_00010, partial [Plasmodium yoelii 17X]
MFFTDSNCSSGEETISSGFIALLTLLNSIDNNEHLEGDQLVEYAILWLSYKLNQKKENGTTKLSDFLTENIKKNSCYDKHIATNTDNGDKIYMECEKFENLWDKFPDKLDTSNNYQFKTENFLDSYCDGKGCDNDLDKINAGFFYLLNQFFGNSESSYYAKNNINIVDYIMLWLSYMLNLKPQVGNVNNLQYFYNTTINNHRYKNSIPDVKEYKNYKDLIDKKKYFLDMDRNIIFNFYEAFKLICEMYNNFDDSRSHCTNCSQYAKKFTEKYEKINQNYDITSNSSYKQLLSTLSTDYNNFKKYYTSKGGDSKDIPSISSVENMQTYAYSSGQGSEDTPSSSSITTRLFTVLSIFGAIAFFLGISYKVNNKELKNITFKYYFNYTYVNVNKKIVRFL